MGLLGHADTSSPSPYCRTLPAIDKTAWCAQAQELFNGGTRAGKVTAASNGWLAVVAFSELSLMQRSHTELIDKLLQAVAAQASKQCGMPATELMEKVRPSEMSLSVESVEDYDEADHPALAAPLAIPSATTSAGTSCLS